MKILLSAIATIAYFNTDDRSSSVKTKRTLSLSSCNLGVSGVTARSTTLPIFNECVRRHYTFTNIDIFKIYRIRPCACLSQVFMQILPDTLPSPLRCSLIIFKTKLAHQPQHPSKSMAEVLGWFVVRVKFS
jgi:hypothetical protein